MRQDRRERHQVGGLFTSEDEFCFSEFFLSWCGGLVNVREEVSE